MLADHHGHRLIDHRHRMRYAVLRAQHLPIGSGVVEAWTLLVSRYQRDVRLPLKVIAFSKRQ
jgi:hypothetical protein